MTLSQPVCEVVGNDVSLLHKQLYKAIHEGDWTTFLECLSQKVDLNVSLSWDHPMNALHLAAKKGHFKMVTHLLDHQLVDLYQTDYHSRSALHIAIEEGANEHLKPNPDRFLVIENLIQRGIDINQALLDGVRPVQTVIARNKPDLLQLLLNHHVELNFMGQYQHSVLHTHAYSQMDASWVPVLVAAGADIHAQTDHHWSALHVAAACGKMELVRTLVDQGANIHMQDSSGMTPLEDAVSNQQFDVADFLVKRGSVLALGPDQGTALHRLAANIDFSSKALHKMIELGVLINQQDGSGKTALHSAMEPEYDAERITAIVNAGIDLNLKDHDGNTALHYGILHSCEITVEALEACVHQGFDLALKNKEGDTLATLAQEFLDHQSPLYHLIQRLDLIQKEQQLLGDITAKHMDSSPALKSSPIKRL